MLFYFSLAVGWFLARWLDNILHERRIHTNMFLYVSSLLIVHVHAAESCGPLSNTSKSVAYAKINEDLYHKMAINFTSNVEYNYVALMIPHLDVVDDLCEVWRNSTTNGLRNAGIESLCYNMTAGAKAHGRWQASTPPSTERS